MTKKLMDKITTELKELKNLDGKSATKKDIQILINGYKASNFDEVKNTKLYNDLGGVYCQMLEILYAKYKFIQE